MNETKLSDFSTSQLIWMRQAANKELAFCTQELERLETREDQESRERLTKLFKGQQDDILQVLCKVVETLNEKKVQEVIINS